MRKEKEDCTGVGGCVSLSGGLRVQVALGLFGDGEGVLVFVFGGHGGLNGRIRRRWEVFGVSWVICCRVF